ncbi:hypothetical protein [Dactylosporangium fulvum]|uniref:Tetratricopeptide repeat protein n=1 Tax=Dactylosporangium fulvum TaxID=53359 RepID=A0ABY5WD00_9ACTN|nr:hypothetical protein [Dactylosporangium fulvum]UWP86984.1 hypothetical protein Dfulv_23185 [Dactylosporangium fulvum]
MVTWARVVLLKDHPRRYELVQAYRILTTVRPQVYRPRLARALGDLVDGFTDAAPADAVQTLLAEAATSLRMWARELVGPGTVDVFTDVVVRQRKRRAADERDGPDWDLLALAVALEEAGRGDAALATIQELVTGERSRRMAPRSRLALTLIHHAGMLERRERSYDAAAIRAEGLELLRRLEGKDDVPPRSDAIATLLTGAGGSGRRYGRKLPPVVAGGASTRTPMRSR